MTGDHSPLSCDHLGNELTELALGTLSGRELAVVLVHVDSCQRCAEEVEDLSRTVDSLLQIAPEAEPPLGFEVRLFERLGIPTDAHDAHQAVPGQPVGRAPTRRGRRSGTRTRAVRARPALALDNRAGRRSLLAAAAVLVAVAGFWTGRLLTTGPSGGTTKATVDAVLHGTGGNTVGLVVVTSGRPGWLFMVVDSDVRPQKLRCEVTLTDGKTVDLGTFWVEPGYNNWSSPVHEPAAEIDGARVVTAGGSPVATATFTSS